MNSVYLIIKTTPFPPITGFEKYAADYYKLRSRWRKFRGEVRDLSHFIITHTVRELETNRTWSLCAEYVADKTGKGEIFLSWKNPKNILPELLPTLNGKGRVWTERNS